MAHVNFFAGGEIDRAGHRRTDEAWVMARLADASTRFVPVWRARNLMTMGEQPGAVLIDREVGAALVENGVMVAFLGFLDEVAHFAIDLSHYDDPVVEARLPTRGEFVDLRNTGSLLDQRSGSLLAYARGLMHWHARHRHCGACGSPTRSSEAGHVRVCTGAGCGAQHFPRTDPAVIMLVSHEDKCLLGRARHFLPGMHSTLAGFVEPGESLEEAVAREVMEETGVAVTDVRYHSSQPWPFPASIMLGFHARATGTALDINTEELEHAAWYSRSDLRNSPEDDTFRMPRGLSIARRLVDSWLEEG